MRPDHTVPRGYVGEATELASEFHCRDFAHEELVSVGEERTSQQRCVGDRFRLGETFIRYLMMYFTRILILTIMMMKMMDVHVQEGA